MKKNGTGLYRAEKSHVKQREDTKVKIMKIELSTALLRKVGLDRVKLNIMRLHEVQQSSEELGRVELWRKKLMLFEALRSRAE